ncbi:MAG: hypothetical protein ACLFPE_11315 [Bacteroidales bacterium]
MEITIKKLNFIRDLISVEDEKVVDLLISIMNLTKEKSQHRPLTEEEFNNIIIAAEEDAKYNRMTSSEDLKKEVKKWR